MQKWRQEGVCARNEERTRLQPNETTLKGTSLEVGILATTLPPNLRIVPTGTRTICEIVQLFQYGFLDLFAHCMQSLT